MKQLPVIFRYFKIYPIDSYPLDSLNSKYRIRSFHRLHRIRYNFLSNCFKFRLLSNFVVVSLFLLFHAMKKGFVAEFLILRNYFNMKRSIVMNSLMVAVKAQRSN